MHILAKEFIRILVSKQTQAGFVGEGAFAVHVDAVDGLACGVEYQIDFFLTLLKCILKLLAHRNVAQRNLNCRRTIVDNGRAAQLNEDGCSIQFEKFPLNHRQGSPLPNAGADPRPGNLPEIRVDQVKQGLRHQFLG